MHSFPVGEQSPGPLHSTQVPAAAPAGSPHTCFFDPPGCSPLQSVPTATGVKVGEAGEPEQAGMRQISLVVGRSLRSSMGVVAPAPSQTTFLQSFDICPVDNV